MEMWDGNPAPKPFIYIFVLCSVARSISSKGFKVSSKLGLAFGIDDPEFRDSARLSQRIMYVFIVNVEASRERDLARWLVGTWTMVDRDLIWKMKGYKVIHETSHWEMNG